MRKADDFCCDWRFIDSCCIFQFQYVLPLLTLLLENILVTMKQTGEAYASFAVRRATISILLTQLCVKTTAPGHLVKTGLNVYV